MLMLLVIIRSIIHNLTFKVLDSINAGQKTKFDKVKIIVLIIILNSLILWMSIGIKSRSNHLKVKVTVLKS